jgi:biopolymer transport protein ExbD
MPLKAHVDEEPSINMTPMVDVVFQLILFFLLGTKFTEMERKIGLEVPRVTENQALAAASDRQVVNIYRDGALTLDGESVSLDQLTDRLREARARHDGLGVLVRGDSTGQFQRVAEVLHACKRAGVRELGISVLPVGPERK